MALKVRKSKLAKMAGVKSSLELPDIVAGLGGFLGGDGVICLDGFLGGRDGCFVSGGRVDVGAGKVINS